MLLVPTRTQPSAPSRSPLAGAVVGAVGIAASGVWVVLADTPPAISAFFRCAYALPVLAFVAWRRRPAGVTVPTRARLMGGLAGLCFTADLVMWHHAIDLVGAGLATVLAAGQVVIVPLVSWALLAERPSRRVLVAIPVMLLGVVTIAGLLGGGAVAAGSVLGTALGAGTGITYAGYILALREANSAGLGPAGALRDSTAMAVVGTAVLAVVQGHGAALVPVWPSAGWLLVLALVSQVVAWLLIATSMPRLPAAVTSVVLTLQPALSLVLGVVLLGERPGPAQLLGVALVVGALVHATGAGARAVEGLRLPARRPASPV